MANKNASYVIVTDSGADMPYEYLDAHGIPCVDLTLHFEGENIEMKNREIRVSDFYARMRAGEVARTSAPSPAAFAETFEEILAQGKDVLYLGFDTGISATVNSALIAAEDLREKYPERKIFVLDSLCASAGLGLVIVQTVKRAEDGMSIEDAYEFAKSLAPQVAHRFTVETLTYLCRGGRVSKTAAFAGNMLSIKPVLHVDDAGKLINIAKARGRMKSLSMLADAFGETALHTLAGSEIAVGAEYMADPEDAAKYDTTYMISQADCMEDAQALADMIYKRFGRKVDMITDIGPVIGSHAGPGTIALFFVATRR
ncbi:MAG: DegV family protein [Lachnospiraceae bacterium]|nr:DegV family protein [Lachnospiraceae bacterium]